MSDLFDCPAHAAVIEYAPASDRGLVVELEDGAAGGRCDVILRDPKRGKSFKIPAEFLEAVEITNSVTELADGRYRCGQRTACLIFKVSRDSRPATDPDQLLLFTEPPTPAV